MPGPWQPINRTDPEHGAPAAPADVQPATQFAPRPARMSLATLVVPETVRVRLDHGLARLRHHKEVFEHWGLDEVFPNRQGTALNFYGPPGTGKSHAAEAIAHALGRQVIDVDYSAIESKYVGETPRNIELCFSTAESTGAVLVFNEADSLLGSRLSQVTQSADHAVNLARNVTLTQLERFRGAVVFTSNFAANYDPAVVRRIGLHIAFELPDRETREQLWRMMLPDRLPLTAEVSPELLAERSDGLSGGDIANVVEAAAFRARAREDAEAAVSVEDLLAEIDAVRRAAEEVGRRHAG